MKKEIYVRRFLPVFIFIVSLACLHAGKLMAAVTTAAEMNTNLVRGDGYDRHYDFELTANDDTAKTGPMQKVRVDVIKNDVLTCDDYSLRIITNLDPVTQGTASIDGDFIVFTPGVEARGTTIPVQYGLTCNNVEVTAILYVNITAYNTPINVVPEEQMCAEEMAQDIAFRIHRKYIGKATNGVLQPFSIPLVGDLNGDGKPEIVMFGVTGTGLTTPVRYIYIFDGQTGNVVLEFRLSTLGSWYGDFRIGDSPWHSSPSHMALADLDGDGIGEIIVCEADDDGNIYALKPVLNANGRITGLRKIWDSVYGVKQPLSGNYQTFGQAMPHIVDLNGDGIPEVVVYNKIYNGQTGKLLMAWNGGAATPRASTLAANTGLYDYRNSDVMHNATYSNNVKNRAMVGRRPAGSSNHADAFLPVPAIVDIDGDGQMEIITGNRIHKFNLNYLGKVGESGDHTQNTYTTIEGPSSVTLPVNTAGTSTKTYYLSDGFTRVADIDGDGKLDIVVMNNLSSGYADVNGLIYIWDPETRALKAANSFRSNGTYGQFGVPFIGDINGKFDGRDVTGGSFTKKVPEILFCAGRIHNDRSTSNSGRSGFKIHPQSNMSNARFSSSYYHIVGLTYDGGEPNIADRLKISWALEHQDQSNNTGITMFDFNNDGAFDLCYRDEQTIRVISPKLGATDYIRRDETEASSRAILFRASVHSETGFEAPAIADVNMDGSADIIVAGYSSGGYRADCYVFEYAPGSEKWAPAPPVWNQGLYNPLHVNEDLTIPARPQSMLTEYVDKDGNTVKPYNGAWIQQPIVKEGNRYVPVVRQPDGTITDMSVSVSGSTATVKVTIRNDGTASINSNTPISFYRYDIGVGNLISTQTVGIDIFPNEKVTRTFTLNGSFNEVLIWAQISDNGNTIVPAPGYSDCNPDNNSMAGIDCPYLIYTPTSFPSSTICGNDGSVMLKAVPTNPVRERPTYQWFRNERLLPGDTLQTYFATQPGEYKCYVIEGICRTFSSSITLDRTYENVIEKPDLSVVPENGMICQDGNAFLEIQNADSYTNPVFYWFKDGQPLTNTKHYYATTQPGIYAVYVVDGSCGSSSSVIELKESQQTIQKPAIGLANGSQICGDEGTVLMRLSNSHLYPEGTTYQWYHQDTLLTNGTEPWYIAEEPGEYFIVVNDQNGCSAFAKTDVQKVPGDIKRPVISMFPEDGYICGENGCVELSVANPGDYGENIRFYWYLGTRAVQMSSSPNYIAAEEGTYYVQALYIIDNQLVPCSSTSREVKVTKSNNEITKPNIASTSGGTVICGNNGSVVLRLTNADDFENAVYQWYNGGYAISGADDKIYIATEAGDYRILVKEENCAAVSQTIQVIKDNGSSIALPLVTLTPANGNICGADGSVLLNVTNASLYINPTYIWFHGNEIVQQGGQSSYIATIEGNYFVQVIESGCASVSAKHTLTSVPGGLEKPVIASLTEGNTICGDNGEVVLKLTTTYTGVTYQWLKDELPVAGNATDLIFRATEAGKYSILVSDGDCSSISDYIEVIKDAAHDIDKPIIASEPNDGKYCAGGAVYLSITNTTAYTNPTYSWFKDNVELNVTTSYHIATTDGAYFVVVKEGTCVSGSDVVNVSQGSGTITKPEISSLNNSYEICEEGGEVILRLTTTYANATYKWFKDGIEQANSNSVIWRATEAGSYYILVQEGTCTAVSDAKQVTKPGNAGSITKPIIASEPNDGRYCAGGAVYLSITNTNAYNNPTYSWFKDNIELNVTTSYHIATTDGAYFVVVKEGTCVSGSDVVNVSQGSGTITKPEISSLNNSYEICEEGGEVILRLTTTYANATYKWFKDGIEQSNSNSVIWRATEAGSYYILVQEGTCTAVSDAKQVTKPGNAGSITKPIIASEPNDGRYCAGGAVYLSITNTNAYNNPTYSWFKDNVELNVTTSYHIATTDGAYFVVVKEGTCVSGSDVVNVSQGSGTITKPEISSLNNSYEICEEGGEVILRLTTTYANATYKWFKDGIEQANSNSVIWRATEAGSYYILVQEGTCTAVSDAKQVTKPGNAGSITKPIIASEPNDGRYCAGGAVYLSITNTNAYNNPTYSWFKDNVELNVTTSYHIATTDGAYFVVVKEGTCVSGSDVVNVSQGSGTITKPEISSLNNSYEICEEGGEVILRLTTTYANATYKWFKDGIEQANSNSVIWRATEAGSYYILVQEGTCTAVSDARQVTKPGNAGSITKPIIASEPNDGKYCAGGAVYLSITNTTAYTNPTYSWFKDNVELNVTTSYHIATTDGAYFVVVKEGTCVSGSDVVNVSQGSGTITKPEISSLNNSYEICEEGGEVILRLTTTYANATYKWFKDGIEQANSNSVIWRATEAGSYYILVQSGTCTAVSDARQVTKPGNAGSIAKPVLDIHPDNAQYCIGGNVYMSVTNLNAYTNPTFSWFKDGVALGVTTSYYITRVNGEYFVVVEDGNCTSSSENINVQQGTGTIATPQMDIYPASQEICGEFGTVVMRLRNASSYLNATYQWYKDGVAIRNANKIMYSAEEEGTYYLQIITSDGCGVVCDPIEITKNNAVIAEIDLEVFPEDAIMRNNDPIEMTVLNGNDYTGAMYYWFKGTDIVSSGINKVRYDAAEIGDYRLLIVDGNSCAVWSQEVNVRDSDCPEYVPEPVIVVTPLANGDQYDLCLPEGSVFFRVSNKDDYDAPAYQWYKNNSPIAGATSFYLEVVNNANLGAGIYRLSITDKGCIVYSRSYNVVNSTGTMPVKPLISAHPTGAAICGNDGAVILRLTNPEEFTGATYQWYKDNEPIAGAGSIIYEATAPGQYRLFVGEGNCSAISGQISVVPGTGNIEKPRLNKNPNQDEICNNGSIRLEVANASSYGNVTYYWYKNTEIVQDGPSPYYFATTAGTYFVQVVDGNTCSAVSEKETLRMSGSTITAPVITTYPSTNMICGEDGVVVLRLTTTYPAGATYQWYRNNMPVAGATSVTYSATEAGDYHLEVISQSCGASSTPVTIQKQNGSSISLPLVTLDPEEMIENDPVALTFANINAYTQPLYHWFTNEKTTLLQSNVLTYEATVTGTYYLLVEDNGCARWSNDIDVREASCVLAKPELNVIPAQNRICGTNGSALIQVSNRNVYANPTYQWYRNNVAIGGNTPTIEVTQDGTYHVKVSDADCYNYSLTETIVRVSSEIAKPFVERIPNGDICGSEGSVILSFINVQEYTSPRYQWYKDNYAITNATELIYVVTEPGKYRVVVEDNGCMAMSAEEDVRRVSGNITQPEISRSPDSYDICINGSIRLDVSNKSDYASNAVYVWYKGDRQVQRSSLTSGFVATEAGQYMVQVIENSCAAVSETTTLNSGGGYINTPVIATYPADPANGNKIVCGENGVVVLRLSNTYAPGTTYQWYKDGIAIAQATGIIYSATETGSYYVEVKNFECAAVSDPVSVVKSSSSFIPKPDLSIDPEDGRIVEGLSAVLQLENPNVYPGRYCYWFKGDLNRFESTASVIRQGANELSYTTDEIGDYRLLIVDGTCASWSDLKQVTIDGMCHIADPVVTAVYDITNVCGANGSVLLQVSNRDQYITPAYQWYKDNSPIGGQTRSTLELSAQDDGLYQVAITDGCRKVSNPAIPITTNNNATIKPLVARTPVNGNLCGASGSVILTFTNAQEFQGATYQWFKDNYEIPNANGRIYEVTQPGRYRVVVRDGNCLAMSVEENVISQSGTIRKPLVSKTPDRNTICANGSIRLSVTNTNEYPSSAGYVWYKDDVRVGDGTDFVATEQGTYFVQVIDGTCSATSRREVLTPSGSTIVVPDVVSYPESINKTICGDYGVVVFRLNNAIQYTGASFQWYRNDEPMANENDIVLSVSEAGTYYLQIISGDCGVISTPITVIKNPGSGSIADPNISMFPTDGEIPSGGSVTLSFNNSAAYSSSVKYYWFRGTSEIVAENTLTYAATQTGRYRLLVVDHDCARWSSRELDVTTGCDAEKPILTVVPSGSSVVCTPNGAILLQVSNRQVYLNPSYEWYDGNTIIPGQTGAALEVTAAGNYRVRVSEAGCKNYSDVQSIGTSNVPGLERPLVSRIPSGGICGNDGSVILRFTNAADFTGATYQWYKDNFAIPNATEEIYEVTQAGKYRIVVIDGGCMVMSAEEDIRTNTSYSIDKPLVSKSPDKTEICVNGSIRLTVTNTSSYDQATYIWYRGSEEVQRSAVPSYVATAGGRYFVQVIDGNTCSATSERIPLTMGSSSISTPEITVYPESNDVCANNGVAVIRLTNSASYTGAAYQWYKNGMPISGETGTVLSVTQAGDYYIEVATIDCYAVSRTVTIRRNSSCTIDPPRIAATPSDAMIVGGNPVVLTLQNPGSYTSPQYYWFKDGETVVQQGTDFTYSATVPGFYKLLVVETGKAAWSNEIEVKESVCPTATPLLSVEPQSLDICGVNGSVYMSLLNIGDFTSGARFEWRRNNVVIANSNFPYYNATEAGLYELRVYDRVNSESCLGVSQSYQVTKTPASFIEPLDIRMTPSSGILCNDGSVILYVYNRGAYEDATYRWYKNGLLIQGATGNTYEVKYENQAETRATYTAQVIEGGCGAVSVDELIVNKSNNTAIKPIVAASGTKVCGEHGSVLLMFSNESDFGSGTKFYQWFYNNELIAGATSPTYEAELGGDYRLQVVAGSCGAFSDVVSLIGSGDEIPKPKVETSPVNGLICGTQGSVMLYLTNVDEYNNPTYQWYKNNMPIQGATGSSYEAFERASYRIQVSENECSALSVPRAVNTSATEIEKPLVEVRPDAAEICGENGVITLRLTNPEVYQNGIYIWYRNDIMIPDANTAIYHATEAGAYRIQVVDDRCAAFSRTIDLRKNNSYIAKPELALTPANGYLCGEGSVVTLSVNNASQYNNATYVWYNANGIVQEGTSSIFETSVEGDYYVQVIDGTCSSLSITKEVRITTGNFNRPEIASTSGGYNVCGTNGVVIMQLTNAGDYTQPVYQWYRNDIAIAGAVTEIYQATEAGSYTLRVTDGDCSAYSLSRNVTKDNSSITKPVIARNPDTEYICGEYGSILLSVANSSSYRNATYIWFKGTTIVQNSAVPTYEAETEGTYYVQVSESGCSSVSETVQLRTSSAVFAKPVIASSSGEYVICGDDGVVTLRLTNPGDYTNPSYQWYKNGIAITGATDIIYHATSEGEYKIQVLDGLCGGFSVGKNVTEENTYIEKPRLSLSPASGIITDGESVTITVTNHSVYTNPSYIWYMGTQIVEQNGTSTYQANVAGTYYVEVVDGNCSSISDPEELRRSGLATPQVSSQPASNTICGVNGVVVLRLENADVYYNPIFQWYRNDVVIPGATAIVYHATQAGNYRIQVETPFDEIYSEQIVITQNGGDIDRPELISIPESALLCGDGGNVEFQVSNASDYTNPTYIWYHGTDVVQNGPLSTYLASTTGVYYVQVVESGCSSVSTSVNVRNSGNNIARARISAIPQSNNICGNNGVVILRLDNEDDYANASYQWYRNDVAIAGANTVLYQATTAGSYSIRVEDGDCLTYSSSINVTKDNGFIERPTLDLSPATGIISEGGSVLLTVNNHSVYTNPTYIWYRGTEILQNNPSFTYNATVAGVYYVQVVEGGCSAVSEPEVLRQSGVVVPTPLITSLPESNTICGNNGVVILRVTNPGDYQNPEFQWLKDGIRIPGATITVYHAREEGNYQVQVIDVGGAANSRTINIRKDADSYIPQPLLAKNPVSGYLCGDFGSVFLSVTNKAEFNNATYVWYHGNEIVQNGPRSTFEAHATGEYYVQVIEGDCSSVSTSEFVRPSSTTINEPYIIATPDSRNICGENGVVVLRMTNAEDYPNATYQWYRYNEPVQGETSTMLVTTIAGEYRIHVMQDHCAAFSLPINVTKDNSFIAKPILAKTPDSGYICGENGSVLIYVTNTDQYSNPTYIWYTGTQIIQRGYVPSIEVISEEDYYVQVIDGGCSSLSDAERAIPSASFIAEPNVVSVPDNNVICGNNGVVLLKLTNENDYVNAVYQWFKDSIAIPGANSIIYHATEAGDYRIIVVDEVCAAFSVNITVRKENGDITRPQVVKAPESGNICGTNGSVMLSVSNHQQYVNPVYHWYRGTQLVQEELFPTYEALVAGEYYVQVVDEGCASVSARTTVRSSSSQINEVVVSATPSSQNICGNNGVVILTVENEASYSNATYQWYRNNVLVPNANDEIYHATTAGEYRVQVIEEPCAAVSAPLTITRDNSFIPKPLVNTSSENNVICAPGSHVTLTVTNNQDYTNAQYIWYNNSEVVQRGTDYNYDATVAGTYYVQVVEGGCSSVSLVEVITVNTDPMPTANISGDITILQGSSADITIDLTGTAPWLVEFTNGVSVTVYNTPYVFTIYPMSDTTITLSRVTDAVGCPNKVEGSVTIRVYEKPTLLIDEIHKVCITDAQIYIDYERVVDLPLNYTLRFSPEAIAVGFQNRVTPLLLPDNEITVRMPANVIQGDYDVDLTISYGAYTITYPIVIRVVPTLAIAQQPVSSDALCTDFDLNLSVDAVGEDLTYQWYFNGNPIPGARANTYTATFAPDMAGSYHVIVNSFCGGPLSSQIVSIQEKNLQISMKWDDVIFVKNTNERYRSYQWYLNGEPIRTDGTNQYYHNPRGLNGEYTVRAYYENGSYDESCPVSVSSGRNMRVMVYPNPVEANQQISVLIETGYDEAVDAKIELYDITGRILLNTVTRQTITELPVRVAPGTYVVRITTHDAQVFVHKIIVK